MAKRLYRGRIAPTPSGEMHLGHAQTFYIAWKRAKLFNGSLVLRVEDLDFGRCRTHYLDQMIDDLSWFGLTWDEGPGSHLKEILTCYGPYEQSKRMDLYTSAWKSLFQSGHIYPSPHSRRDIISALSAPHEEHNSLETIFPPHLRPDPASIPRDLIHPGTQNWRFRVPDGRKITYRDIRCGEKSYTAGEDFGDFLIWRSDGYPSYELAVVVDDYAMGITEVVRGEDLLLSTARQILLYEALGWDASIPNFFHCPLVRDGNGVRLAKRAPSSTLSTLRSTPTQTTKQSSKSRSSSAPEKQDNSQGQKESEGVEGAVEGEVGRSEGLYWTPQMIRDTLLVPNLDDICLTGIDSMRDC
jgi:glutamyl/glutaminyl-tRNA synthetase